MSSEKPSDIKLVGHTSKEKLYSGMCQKCGRRGCRCGQIYPTANRMHSSGCSFPLSLVFLGSSVTPKKHHAFGRRRKRRQRGSAGLPTYFLGQLSPSHAVKQNCSQHLTAISSLTMRCKWSAKQRSCLVGLPSDSSFQKMS